jgi:hypothetical protein
VAIVSGRFITHYVNEKFVKGFRQGNWKERGQMEDLGIDRNVMSKLYVRGTDYGVIDWIKLAHDRVK